MPEPNDVGVVYVVVKSWQFEGSEVTGAFLHKDAAIAHARKTAELDSLCGVKVESWVDDNLLECIRW